MRTIIETLRESLPVVVARSAVPKLVGGAVAAQTLANADSQGTGPADAVRVNGKVCYPKESLLAWLEPRIQRIESVEKAMPKPKRAKRVVAGA